jgi:hypothetical protein
MGGSALSRVRAALLEYRKVSTARAVARHRNLARRLEGGLATAADAWRKTVTAEVVARRPRTASEADGLPAKGIEGAALKLLAPVMAAAFQAGYRKLALVKQRGDEEEAIGQAAKRFLATKGAMRIREITSETRRGIKAIIRQAIEQGYGPDKVGRSLRSSVGLTDRLALAVGRRYTKMIEEGLADELAWSRAERYARKLQTYRTKMIARTETNNALRDGIIEAAKDHGVELLDRVGDPEACADCVAANEAGPYTPDEAAEVDNLHPQDECTFVIHG